MRILQDQTVGADFREQEARGPAGTEAARALSSVFKFSARQSKSYFF